MNHRFRESLIVWLVSISASAFMLVSAATHAATPTTISYQGYLQDSAQTPINASVSMTFRIYTTASGGGALWEETQSLSVTNGIFSATLGAVTALNLSFDVQYYLGVTVNADSEMTPRQAISSSAYARRTAHVDDGSIFTQSIQDGAVSGAKIAANAVTSSKIADGVITSAKLAAGTLVLSSSIRVGNDAAVCSVNNAGAIRWTGTAFQGCNGTAWVLIAQ